MAPLPNECSLYDSSPVEGQHLVSWKDDPSPSVFETAPINTAGTSSGQESTTPSATSGCRSAVSKVVPALKESWRNPRYFRWIMTIITAILFTIALGFVSSFGPLYMCFRRDLKSTAVETGWVASLGWATGVISPLINVMYQRVGPRKIALVGTLLCFVGLLSSSFVESVWPLFITYSIICGFGITCLIASSMNLIASHFDSHDCALPTTLPGVGGSIGMLIYSPLLELAYERFGWRAVLRFAACLILVTGLLCSIWYKRPASQKSVPNTSDQDAEAKGKEAGPSVSATVLDAEKVRALQAKQDKLLVKKERGRKSKKNYIYLFKSPIHWMFCLAITLSNVVMVFNIINLVSTLQICMLCL